MCFMSAPRQPDPPINRPDYTPDQSERAVQMTISNESQVTPKAPTTSAARPSPVRNMSGSKSGIKM